LASARHTHCDSLPGQLRRVEIILSPSSGRAVSLQRDMEREPTSSGLIYE
jgi:hypothetical protein